MLASSPYTSTHHLPLSRPHSSSSSLQPSKRTRLSSSATPSPSDKSAKLHSYFHTNATAGATTPVVVDTSDVPIDNIDLYMPNSYDFHSSQNSSYPFGITDAHDNLSMWSVGGGNIAAAVANPMGSHLRQGQNHQRQPSTSSIGSTASVASSPYQVHQAPHNVRGSNQTVGKPSNISHGSQRNQSSTRSHLPTPTQTPTRNTFLAQHPSAYSQQDLNSVVQASLLMNSALLEQKYHGEDDVPQMSHSNRPSFSSMGQAPATPMAAVADRHDGQQIMNNGEKYSSDIFSWMSEDLPLNNQADSMTGTIIPKFNRTVTDAYQDNLYFVQPPVSQQPSNPSYLMPANSMVNDRLLEAQMARSQSSGSNQSASLSPFRYGRADNEQQDLKYQLSPQESEPKTISPKDAVLDYSAATNDYPLFPQSTADLSGSYAAVAPIQRRDQQYNDASSMDQFNNNSQVWGSNMQAFTAAPMQSFNSFATPALPTNMNLTNMSGFIGNSMAQPTRSGRRQTERTPEFHPAQLTRMESSASEAPQSSQASSAQIVPSPKPDSSADTGTYSCTYHGCLQRFTTPQKLQKHKRDSHRNNPHVTPGVGSGMSTAQLMERNSQTGPHICGRTNPTTGKPCDAVFSRPYDLTRHEDTIHNIRKQKVRCAICTEEKTFSRSDALTRHMRVVHPEVDFPGKHRKRGSRDD